jgi:hypothetical protein
MIAALTVIILLALAGACLPTTAPSTFNLRSAVRRRGLY